MQREVYFSEILAWKLPFCLCTLKPWKLKCSFATIKIGPDVLAGKKNFLCCSSYYHIHCFFLCIFVCSLLFILCLGFRHLDQRKTTQMLKSLFLSQAITSPTEHHLPIPSLVQWLHMKWVKITNIKMSLKNYSIQNVLELIKICFIVQSISRVATLTCAKSTIEESILVD